VGAFDAVGSILVVALMVTPAAAAYLLTDDLRVMLALSVLIGAASAITGYWLARALDGNIAGAMATMTGVSFLLVLLFAPDRGLVAVARRRVRQRWEFALAMLTVHLLQHEADASSDENRVDHLVEHIRWQPGFAEQVVRYAERKGAVRRQAGRLHLTDSGRILAQQRVVNS
jgi:manganese/zinc/iron transport system permease protein